MNDNSETVRSLVTVALIGIMVTVAALVLLWLGQGAEWSYFGALGLCVVYGWLLVRVGRERDSINARAEEEERRKTHLAEAEAYRIKAQAKQILNGIAAAQQAADRRLLTAAVEAMPERIAAPDGSEWARVEDGTKNGLMIPYNREEIDRIAAKACRILVSKNLEPSQGNIIKHAGASGNGQAHGVQLVMAEWGWIEQARPGAQYTWTAHVTGSPLTMPPPAPAPKSV